MRRYTILILLLTISFLSFGQSKNSAQIKEMYWGAGDKFKKVIDIPQKWEGESAVVIYQEFNYIYEGSKKSVDYIESIRRRVKLLDKSAVDIYSEFSFAEKFKVEKGFSKKGGRVYAGFKVVKPDGTESEVDLSDAVEIKSNNNEKLKKIAIPNLEPGDIIDYYYYIYEPFISFQEYIFEPVITILNGTYPSMHQKISFEVEKDFFVNFNSYNDAPKLKEVPSKNKKKTIYSIDDLDREKFEDERWFFEDRVYPLIKFQVVYARKDRMEDAADAFIGTKGEVLKEIDKLDILDYYKERISFNYNLNFSDINSHIRSKGIKSSETEKIVKEVYLFLRYKHLIKKIEPYIFLEEGFISYLSSQNTGLLTELGFIITMGNYLMDKGIDFDVVVASSRKRGNISDILLKDETELLLKVNTKTPIFLSPFSIHTDAGIIPHHLEGTDAYLMESYPRGLAYAKDTKIPVSDNKDNRSITSINLVLDEDMETVNVSRTSQHFGHNKYYNQDDLIFIHDYINDDYKYFDEKPYIERAPIKKKDVSKVEAILNDRNEKNLEKQKEVFQSEAEDELNMEFLTYDSYEITDLGRWSNDENSSFSYNETFTLDGVTKRAGKNYILDIGKFIGGQVTIQEDEMERTNDIYMDNPRSFVNKIDFKIPEGYTVQGLENLEKNINNNTGSFVSTAIIEEGVLKIVTTKVYNNNFEKKEDWDKMVDFLDAAYQFTQEKILLKKH